MNTLPKNYRDVNRVPKLDRVVLEFQGGLVKVGCRLANAQIAGGGRRGKVNEFSAASRRRMLQLFARLRITEHDQAVFITLTYPADFPSPKVAKKNLRAFLARLDRCAPGCSAIWRMEFQQRGAPHFHIVVFSLPFLPKETVQLWWAEIIGADRPFTRIESIRDRRKLTNYVSKYVAKLGGGFGGFNLLAYLHGDEFVHPQTGEMCGSVGRWWGVFNAAALPFAVLDTVEIDGGFEGFYRFRRGARKVFRGVAGRSCQGFFLFVGDAGRWRDYWFGVVTGSA